MEDTVSDRRYSSSYLLSEGIFAEAEPLMTAAFRYLASSHTAISIVLSVVLHRAYATSNHASLISLQVPTSIL
jgi:hypothetical protein